MSHTDQLRGTTQQRQKNGVQRNTVAHVRQQIEKNTKDKMKNLYT